MKDNETKKKNLLALALTIVAGIVAIIFMLFPAYSFDADYYSNRSTNTIIGDETYQTEVVKVNKEQDKLVAQGLEFEYREEQITKTNNSGKVSNIVEFKLHTSFMKSMLNFMGSGLASSYVLMVILLCIILSIALMITGSLTSLDCLWIKLSRKDAAFRTAAIYLLLVAVLLVPVFFMTNTYAFSRQPALIKTGLQEFDVNAYYEKMNYLLFDGKVKDNIATCLSSLKFSVNVWPWLTVPSIFAMIIGAISLRYGKIKQSLARILLYFFIIVVCVITLYPYYVMFVTGFRTSAETNDMYFLHLLPVEWVWSNLKAIVNRGVLKYLLNSLLIAGGATVIALFCGIPAAYAMARMNFKGKKIFLGFVIMSQMFSPVVLLIGISQLMSTLNLNDSIVGLMLINAAFNQAFAIWLLRGTFISISPEMEKAARIDGCTVMGSLRHILLPMAAPGIVTTLIFVFINAWNEYTISTVLISTATNRPITVGITQFSSFNMIEWQYLFAASLIATIPVVILFMCIEKHLAAGLTSGGVKG